MLINIAVRPGYEIGAEPFRFGAVRTTVAQAARR
jgi:hypothetical protein